jgi:hypothetical protein
MLGRHSKHGSMVTIHEIRKFGSDVVSDLGVLLSHANVALPVRLLESINTWTKMAKCRLPQSFVADLLK